MKQLRTLSLATALLASASYNAAEAATGIQSNGGGVIGTQHVNFAVPFGDSISFVSLGGVATGTGTFVPSAVPGQLKFLTAAHNIDNDDNGIPDFANAQLFFGPAPGAGGAAATFSVNVTAAQVAINPAWSQPGNAGQATNDLTVITFNVADIVAVTGGNLPQVTPLSTANPLGQQAVIIGHGLHADGTVDLTGVVPAGNDVDGVLKGGTNIIDFVGVPGNVSPPTISPNSGIVVLADFDDAANANSTFNGTNNNPALEAGTAAGDSGSPILVDTNGDGIFEIAGVLNGGDNPFGAAGQFGDVSQYAPIFTEANQAFLRNQGVLLGTDVNGVVITGNIAVVDIAQIAAQQAVLGQSSTLVANQIEALQRSGDVHLDVISLRRFRAASGLSLLQNSRQAGFISPAGAADTYSATVGLAAPHEHQLEFFTAGGFRATSGRRSTDYTTYAGQIGAETRLSDTILGGLVVGLSGSSGDYDADTASLAGYVIANLEPVTVSGAIGWAHHNIDTRTAGAAFRGKADLFSAELGLSTNITIRDLILTPNGTVRYMAGELDNPTTIIGGVTTRLADQSLRQVRGDFGLTASVKQLTDWGVIVPYAGASFGFRVGTARNSVTASAAINPFFGLQAGGGGVNLVNLANALALTGTARVDSKAIYGRVKAGVEILRHDGIGFSIGGNVLFEDDGPVDAAGVIGASIRL